MSEPTYECGRRSQRDKQEQKLVTCLHKLLIGVPLEQLLAFLHQMRIQHTLCTDGKGTYRARVFQHWIDDETGDVVRITEWENGGKTAHSAITNAIADFLVAEGDDFHAFVDRGWPHLDKP
jgi:hypothetical protein